MFTFLLILIVTGENTQAIQVAMEYAPIPEEEGVYLQLPFSIAFDAKGDLYVLDALSKKVHVWSDTGVYRHSFGKSGLGPGELSRPESIDILDDRLWIYDHSGRRLTQFSLEGKVLKSIKTLVRASKFVALRDDLFLTGYKKHSNEERTKASFEVFDDTGRVIRVLKQFDHGGYLQYREGDVRIKAFGPDMVIQKIAPRRWLFGFSQNKTLYEVNDSGVIVTEHELEMFTEKPSDLDEKLIKTLTFPTSSGTRGAFSKWKHLKFSFDHDKAYYTHFTKTTDHRIVFALTPLGGFGAAAGFNQATYFVSDMQAQRIHSHGFYVFPEDSIVLYQAGRVVVFEVNDEGSYTIKSILLRGS